MAVTGNQDRLVTIFGGSGFVGRHLVRALAKRDYRIRVAVRRPDLAGHLQPLGRVGQIVPVQANIRMRESIDQAVRGSFAVVNLVGILAESGRQSFEAVQASGARAVAEAAKAAGAERFVQISSIGADPQSDSAYARSKAAGEAAAFENHPRATVMRPSIIFGPEDSFFNRFAAMARLSPALPLIAGDTRFQPVAVWDVAEALAKAVDGDAGKGKIYELGGPEVRTFEQLLRLMLDVIDRRRLLVPVPMPLARLQASVLQYLPGAPLTPDQLRQLARDNVVSAEAEAEGRTLEGLGIAPRAMEVVLPTYLARFRRAGQFTVPRY